ncbi:MAG: ABC transporter ATP-binding protein [Ignavibacteria bacterium]|jgi:putative ABC transport system ATP-binding protein|nr:ABC transporter ATP-binding protein [Ignavibacteria bacterium]MCU7504925.1 ABC transporter ATP-binding protein [Ignavibacteria bacterium]MCU7517783.1 ABC transporter ATP-binding protein [Ignavibacteria bacterium]
MKGSEIIKVHGLIKDYSMGKQSFRALNDVNMSVCSGEFTGLVGPSGSGKTTLLNIIGALDNPTEGDAVVLGKDVNSLSQAEGALLRNESLGFIFQTYNLLPVYTVYENVEFPLLLLKKSKQERNEAVMKALEWVGLTAKAKSKPNQLSGGESQRVAVARAMVKLPKIVLADEPTANLDAANSHNILKMMLKLNEELNTTFIFATHDEKVIAYLKRKVVLSDGKIIDDITLN